MGAALQEWMLDQISNFELEKWLNDDNAIENDLPLKCDFPSEIHSSVEDIWLKENDYWLEEIPLFEEILPLEELKTQAVHSIKDAAEKENQEKFFNNAQNETATEIQAVLSQPQDLLTTSMENTTLFFTDDILYIKTDPNVDFAFLQQDKGKTSEASSEVEEIIRSTAMELDQWESDTTGSETSSGSSCGTSEMSSNTAPEEEESNDPEWRPDVFKPYARRAKTAKAGRGAKSQEDKVNRKKEQNKNAATRYRQKKKAEVHKILREEEELKKAKAKLTEKVFDIESEIKCLKGLMRDLFKAKGLI